MSFGGVWNYTEAPPGQIDIPQTNPFQHRDDWPWQSEKTHDSSVRDTWHVVSPMYEGLETNIPHTLMAFSDEPSLQEHQLFPTRETVTKYLEDYSAEVRHLVRFHTIVLEVRQMFQNGGRHWLVRLRDLETDEMSECVYDAIVVASGHYDVPMLPEIKGIREWNKANRGAISHSRCYRRPDGFSGKKVVIVGNSASGIDIASQIATVCKHPIVISQRRDSPMAFAAAYKQEVPEIVEFLPPTQHKRAVRFANGCVETSIDAVLFCTGYYYSFPFLSSLRPQLISTGDRVQHLYQHLFYIDNPSLAFVGLPSRIIPFRTFEGQAAVIARIWANRLGLPSKTKMEEWEADTISERGNGKGFHVLPFPKDFEYHNSMVVWAMQATESVHGKMPLKWSEKESWKRERFPEIKKAFANRREARHNVKTMEELGFDYNEWLKEHSAVNNVAQ